MTYQAPSRLTPTTHQRNADKLSKIPVKVEKTKTVLRKPDWIRIKVPSGNQVARVKQNLRANSLHSVCEEAACPNLGECFSQGTATFMILGDLCTRRCPFCDVAHGRPQAPDKQEPFNLANTIEQMGLRYVVITSVNRDDLKDGGAGHFAACIQAIRQQTPNTRIEILVPDFRGRQAVAIEALQQQPCDVFNHNLETVPRLYKKARPGANYVESLKLLQQFKQKQPHIPTKSGLMVGIGETEDEVVAVMEDLLTHGCSMLTIGQYLQPSKDHLPVHEYIHPDQFKRYANLAKQLGFQQVASAPLVRSSYHADLQAQAVVSVK
ncbi:lipoyl synthase [methane-oxidizing endosymbiont of Gigantopelta aegis]|uniref:lipoyl synthase n=1 Tax=methane-oxidizing endosymbiont of Gigantopelta aegis TaxID=2794938 RepID=UPI0018DD38D5|nr:lipoyl synthase [methane-oxidizing endosymbiont of Gigantopelta aegis]